MAPGLEKRSARSQHRSGPPLELRVFVPICTARGQAFRTTYLYGLSAGTHSLHVRRTFPLSVSRSFCPARFAVHPRYAAWVPSRPSSWDTGRHRAAASAGAERSRPITASADEVSESIPAACVKWMPGLAPEVAETWVAAAMAQARSSAIALRQPNFTDADCRRCKPSSELVHRMVTGSRGAAGRDFRGSHDGRNGRRETPDRHACIPRHSGGRAEP